MKSLRCIRGLCGGPARVLGAAALLLLLAPAAWAHLDPPGSTSSAVGGGVRIFRDAACTEEAPDPILTCETVYIQATLSLQTQVNGSSFEAGRWRATSATAGEFTDGDSNFCTTAGCGDATPLTVGLVGPLGYTPCVGNPATSTDDPASAANNGRGLCEGAPSTITSDCVAYTPNATDIANGGIILSSVWGDLNIPADPDTGYSHRDADDNPGASFSTSEQRIIAACPTGECFGPCVETNDVAACTFAPDSTTCTDTDGNECTIAGCPGDSGVCDQRHNLPDSTPCDDAVDTECATPGCDGTGVCDPLHILVADSTPCTNEDNNVCTISGCDGAGVCDPRHSLPDSTPCTPANPADPECATPGCDGAGVCDPLHVVQPFSTPCTNADTNPCNEPGCDGDGVCDQDHLCEPEGKTECEVIISDCIWRDSNDPLTSTIACQDPGDGSPVGCPGGINGVAVELFNCDDPNNPVSFGTANTAGGGFYSFTVLSVNNTDPGLGNCVPENQDWQIEVADIGDFVAPNDVGCNEDTDSDCVEQANGEGLTDCREVTAGTTTNQLDCGGTRGGECCLLIIDEEGLDNDFQTVEHFANNVHLIPNPDDPPPDFIPEFTPGELINDECHNDFNTCLEPDAPPSLTKNWDLVWNLKFPGDVIKLPTGQRSDVGWFQLPGPDNQRFLDYLDGLPAPWNTYDGFKEGFVAGVIPEQYLDKVPDVLELRNQEIEALVGQTCVAVGYDSDISSINYNPLSASLKGERYGLFTFEILAVETPGSLPRSQIPNGPGAETSDQWPYTLQESKSSDSLYDVWLKVLDPLVDPLACVATQFDPRQDPPDSCAITSAKWVSNNGTGTLTVKATSDFGPKGAFVTLSVDNIDKGGDPDLDPILLEVPMTNVLNSNGNPTKKYTFSQAGLANLKGRRISVQSNEGCVYNAKVTTN